MKLVEAVLVAEFDIDEGSSLTHQYPLDFISSLQQKVTENTLAELMLPDGAHLRDEDWTFFFLNQRTEVSFYQLISTVAQTASQTEIIKQQSTAARPQNLIHVLTCVRTKQIQGAKRGARVKSMAIASRYPFVHVFKPLLILVLERYFQESQSSLPAMLYDCINQTDIGSMPLMTLMERQILRGGCSTVLMKDEAESCSDVSALLCSPKHFSRFAEDSQLELSQLSKPSATIQSPKPKVTFDGTSYHFETKVNLDSLQVPMKIPLDLFPEEIGDFSVAQLVNIFHNSSQKASEPSGIMIILHALLSQKRMIFLGYQMPAGEVAKCVLSAISLCSPVLRGFSDRAFPYTSLTNIEYVLKVPGYIAGVTNPAFQSHDDWWDVLCDIPSGKVQLSSKFAQASLYGFIGASQISNSPVLKTQSQFTINSAGTDNSNTQSLPQDRDNKERELVAYDNEFMSDVLFMIQNRQMEADIRRKFTKYVRHFVSVAASYEYDLVKMGFSSLNQFILKKPQSSNLLTRFGTARLQISESDEVEITSVHQGKYILNEQAEFQRLPGPRAVFADLDQKRSQYILFYRRVQCWKNTQSYDLFINDWLGSLKIRASFNRSSVLDHSDIESDDFLKALYDHNHLKIDQQDTKLTTIKSQTSLASKTQNAYATWFDEADVAYLVNQFKMHTQLDSSAVLKIYNQLILSTQIELQLKKLFTILPMNEGGLTLLTTGLYHRELKVRHKCADLLKQLQKSAIGASFMSKLNAFSIAAFVQQEQTAVDMLVSRKKQKHNDETLKHLVDKTIGSADSVAYNPSYMSFSEPQLNEHEFSRTRQESLVSSTNESNELFDEGIDFFSPGIRVTDQLVDGDSPTELSPVQTKKYHKIKSPQVSSKLRHSVEDMPSNEASPQVGKTENLQIQ